MTQKITESDKESFRLFVKQASDQQVLSIYQKEAGARQKTFANIAKEEAKRRGLM